MMKTFPYPATLNDLMGTEGRAELIAGRIVQLPAMGPYPCRVKGNIAESLNTFAKTMDGEAEGFGGCLIYAVPRMANGRESFCPDASLHRGPWPENPMSWIPATPTFAVEIWRHEDYSNPNVEAERAAKRVEYFEAGTLVVWDVNVLEGIVTKFTPGGSAVFTMDDTADAEPAVPGWRITLSDIFEDD